MANPDLIVGTGGIQKILSDFAAAQPAEVFFHIPPDYGIAIGKEVERGGGYIFDVDETFAAGEYGPNSVEAAITLAALAVRDDIEVGGYVSSGGHGVAVCGFEEDNGAVAEAVLRGVTELGQLGIVHEVRVAVDIS
jgi:hypothetical protein